MVVVEFDNSPYQFWNQAIAPNIYIWWVVVVLFDE